MTEALKTLESKAEEIFLKRPDWKRRFEEAPPLAKDYYRLMWAMSIKGIASGNGKCDMAALGAEEERDRIYTIMDDEAWTYVLRNAGHAEALGLAIVRKHMQGQIGKRFGYWRTKD
jgi:hypothetical protein